MTEISSNAVTIFIPSGAGAPGFAGILRCLQSEPNWRIIAGDCWPHAYGKALADEFFLMPPSSDEVKYMEALLSVCSTESVDVVLPITTRELDVLSKHADLIETAGIKLILSTLMALNTANNKGILAEFAKKLMLPVPAFEVVQDKLSFVAAAKRLSSKSEKLCFKPVMGNGSRGFGIIVKDHNATGSDLENKAGILPLTLDEWQYRIPDQLEPAWIISAYLPGKEYSVDMLCDQGKTLFCVPRSRDKMIGGISVAGVLERNFGLIAFCIQLAQALELHGPIGMQWKEDSEGVPHLLEVNPRLQGTTSVLALAGLNIPVQAVKMAMGETLSQQSADIEWGKRFIRFWDERITD
ncbi:MAG: ATP-grasp domain-containing protein [Bacteroidetes bacterium]|nr:ATP-grasp domain-containing protein [Bacteroidota bacterium]